MELNESIKKLIEVFKVANDEVIGNVAAELFNLNWKEGLSRRNQAHKILEQLALTNQIIKGKGFYAVKGGYRGEYKDHDKAVTHCIKDLILTKLPISIHRETSFPVNIRSDILVLIGKDSKATCAVIEVALTETPEYLQNKIDTWKNWKESSKALSELFGIPIPYFSLVVKGQSAHGTISYEDFLKKL